MYIHHLNSAYILHSPHCWGEDRIPAQQRQPPAWRKKMFIKNSSYLSWQASIFFKNKNWRTWFFTINGDLIWFDNCECTWWLVNNNVVNTLHGIMCVCELFSQNRRWRTWRNLRSCKQCKYEEGENQCSLFITFLIYGQRYPSMKRILGLQRLRKLCGLSFFQITFNLAGYWERCQ